MQTHYLRFKLIDDQIKDEEQPIVGTGRKDKFGKKGGMEALIAAGLVMKGQFITVRHYLSTVNTFPFLLTLQVL